MGDGDDFWEPRPPLVPDHEAQDAPAVGVPAAAARPRPPGRQTLEERYGQGVVVGAGARQAQARAGHAGRTSAHDKARLWRAVREDSGKASSDVSSSRGTARATGFDEL